MSVDPHRAVRSTTTGLSAMPSAQGLYDPRAEKDSCGVAFVATLTGEPSHDIVDQALTALRNMEHRGASGAEPDSGDGAGILLQIPDGFLRAAVAGVELPPAFGTDDEMAHGPSRFPLARPGVSPPGPAGRSSAAPARPRRGRTCRRRTGS